MSLYESLIQEGKIEGKIEIILNMIDDKFELVRIAKITEMSVYDVKSILIKYGRKI